MVERRFWLRVHRHEHGAFAVAESADWDLHRGQCGAVRGAAHVCRDDPAARIRRTEPVDRSGDSPYVTLLRFTVTHLFGRNSSALEYVRRFRNWWVRFYRRQLSQTEF